MKVFWDTNVFIYLLEKHPTYYPKVRALYHEHRDRGDQLVTSALTLGELLAQPLRCGREDLAQRYRQLLGQSKSIELVLFDQIAAEHYARIRAATSLRQPDALQLACAASAGASTFVTNDQLLWSVRVPGIETIRGL